MLSRVAERMYWLGRYTERAENTARLLSVNANLALDLPRGVHLNWAALVGVTGSHELFSERHTQTDERTVVQFLLAEPRNSGSLLASLAHARENARTTRDVISPEAFEHINDLHLHAQQHIAAGARRNGRHDFLAEIISGCQQLHGIMSSTMSHDDAHNFTWLGRTLERADMTTRILDLGRADFLPTTTVSDDARPYENLLWVSVLRSVGAYHTYRRCVQARVEDRSVVNYLLKDKRFPRSVTHCLGNLESCLRELPASNGVRETLRPVSRTLHEADAERLLSGGLHAYLDGLQCQFSAVHDAVIQTWLKPPTRRSAA